MQEKLTFSCINFQRIVINKRYQFGIVNGCKDQEENNLRQALLKSHQLWFL